MHFEDDSITYMPAKNYLIRQSLVPFFSPVFSRAIPSSTNLEHAQCSTGKKQTKKMAAIGDGDIPPPNKKVKLAPCEAVIPKLPKKKIALLREALLGLENDIQLSFNLLKITNSNAEMCVPFKNSFLKIERSADIDPPETTRVYSFASVFKKGVNILKLYLEDQENAPEDKETRIALQRLAQTILKIEG